MSSASHSTMQVNIPATTLIPSSGIDDTEISMELIEPTDQMLPIRDNAANSQLLSSFLGRVCRILAAFFYLFATILVFGFSIAGMLALHFAFFLPQVSQKEDSRTTLSTLTVLFAVPSIGTCRSPSPSWQVIYSACG